MKIYYLIICISLTSLIFAQPFSTSKAEGSFLSFGVGPRMPVFDFFRNTDLGYGLNVEFSYTNTDILPIFVYASTGFDQFPGSQNFYQESDYANFHTNALTFNFGLRHYFSPLVENIVLFMPFVQGSVNYTYFQKLHEFKLDRNKTNFLEENSKIGLSVGFGFSMFLMEVLGSYNFIKSNNFLLFDFKVRIPIFVNF
ncbi:MAG: hypothetical protein N2043_11680 [Ignavibacterium sp.]|nr:hypothetical protein [Ignavibacterium sp.]